MNCTACKTIVHPGASCACGLSHATSYKPATPLFAEPKPTMEEHRMDSKIQIYDELEQGTDEWRLARCGLLTASAVCKIMTPAKLKFSQNDACRTHAYDVASERITKFCPDHFMTFAMARGHEEEIYARDLYDVEYAKVREVGFVTNSTWGFTIGYSPDGLVGEDGLIEIKSRASKYQARTIIEKKIPMEFMLQLQTGMLVSNRKWCDFISYSNGMPMFVMRAERDEEMCNAIIDAAASFEAAVNQHVATFLDNVAELNLRPTERRQDIEDIIV